MKIDGSMHSIRLGDKSVQHTFLISPDMEQTILGADFLKGTGSTLVTDIAAVIKQRDGVIEYASRVLTKAEQKYSTTEKECSVIVWVLIKWRPYLLGQRFRFETNHPSLECSRTTRDPRRNLVRRALWLQEYQFTIQHVPGKENHLADWLSRPEPKDEAPRIMIGANSLVIEMDPGRLVQIQRQAPVLQKVVYALLDGRSIGNGERDNELETPQSHFDRLSLNDAGTMKRTLDGLQNPGVQIACDENLVDPEYAGHIVLLFEGKAQVFLDELTEVIRSFGMHFAPTTRKVMLLDIQSLNTTLTIQGVAVEVVERLTYPSSGSSEVAKP
ncbi:hypothetical protein T265_09847 [Opisthorchis viverrini]|uniref:Reverse transcriptase RNase H-like domain-containing protein n=1 Tax=Opisthorchis viverrini TaxID=6198 RepID=A0A074Z4F5_OPIVI|nr:hypothetical protein T265_09847 [Opisthorchis viverrini]KER21948.1 hypothetical protein T265_09847 [Opisthorchis viverrini]